MPKARKSPIDRFTNASASAVSAGFSAALAFGTQPIIDPSKNKSTSSNTASNTNNNQTPIFTHYDPNNNLFNGSGGMDEEEEEDEDGDAQSPVEPSSKAKGKKAAKPQSASAINANSRKEQNRLAQRDFRQRKQQYLRALEARVELLSASHDEQVDRLRYALRALLNENNHLRSLVSTLSSFIGNDNLGGTCQRAGLDRELLEEMISTSAEKRMTEIWSNWPGATECQALKDLRKETQIPLEGYSETGDSYAPPPEGSGGNGRKRKKMTGGGVEKDGDGNGNGNGEKKLKGKSKEKEKEKKGDEDGNGEDQNQFVNQRRASLRSQVLNAPSQYQQNQSQQNPFPTSSSSLPSTSLPFLQNFNSNDPFSLNGITTPSPNANYSEQVSNLLNPSSSNNNNGSTPFSYFGSNSDSDALLAGLFGTGPTPSSSSGNGQSQITSNAQNGNGNNPNYFGLSNFNFPNNALNKNNTQPQRQSSTSSNHSSPKNLRPTTSSGQQINLSTIMSNSNNNNQNHNVMSNPLGKEILTRIIKIFQIMNQISKEEGIESFWPIESVTSSFINLNFPSDGRKQNSLTKSEIDSLSLIPSTPSDQETLDLEVNEFKKHRLLELNGEVSKGPFRNEEILDRLGQAMSQMTYYMSQYRNNSSFVLPRLLRPSELQQTRPHDPLIDGLPISGLRDGLIEHEDKLDSDLIHLHLIDQILVHEGDVMSAQNWEIYAPFYYRYPFLADPASLEVCNGWRRNRGEEPLTVDGLWDAHEKLYPGLEKRF